MGRRKNTKRNNKAATRVCSNGTPNNLKVPAKATSLIPIPAGTGLMVEVRNITVKPTIKRPKGKGTPTARKQKNKVRAVKPQSMETQKRTTKSWIQPLWRNWMVFSRLLRISTSLLGGVFFFRKVLPIQLPSLTMIFRNHFRVPSWKKRRSIPPTKPTRLSMNNKTQTSREPPTNSGCSLRKIKPPKETQARTMLNMVFWANEMGTVTE